MLCKVMQTAPTVNTGDHSFPSMDAQIWEIEHAMKHCGTDIILVHLHVRSNKHAIYHLVSRFHCRELEGRRTGCTGAWYLSFTTKVTAGGVIGYVASKRNCRANTSPYVEANELQSH